MFFKLSRFFIILFILLSFITQSLGETGILFRITPPDIAGALAIVFYVLSGRWFSFQRYWYIYLFIIALSIGGLFGYDQLKSVIEVIIHLFLFLIFVVILAHFGTREGLRKLIVYFAIAGILASLFGIYDFASGFIGTPRIFPARVRGEVLSGFRNAGQAGAYALILLTVLIPIRSSKMYDLFNKKEKKIISISLIVTLLFLFLTGKIAAYIGFAVGITFFFFIQRNFRAFYFTFIASVLFIIVYNNLDTIAPDIAQRITGKYDSRIGNILSGEREFADDDSFIGQNVGDAINSFISNPFIGSGIGAFSGSKYGKFEVHSTYFKIIGETGLIGVISYIILIVMFLRNLKQRKRGKPLNEFLFYITPFLVGCFVSWAYTYHLRKREFWIMFAIIYIVDKLIKADLKKIPNKKVVAVK